MGASSIGSSLESLLQRLTVHSSSSATSCLRQDELEKINRIVEDLEDVVKDWRAIQALLADAEERQICERHVRLWLNDLRELAYRIEYLLDGYEYEVVAREVEASKALSSYGDASTSKGRKLKEPCDQVRPSMVTYLSPLLDASFRDQTVRDVERIKKALKSIAKRRKDLCLKCSDGKKHSSEDGISRRPPTGHVPTDPVFLGRNRDMEQLRETLLADHGDGEMNAEVIAVIGRGGAGKTTLAQHLYEDPQITRNFAKRGWVHVSQNFDVTRLTHAMIESFSKRSCDLKDFSPMQDKLIRLIENKKVLLVMDDVWNTGSWESVVAPFIHKAKKGSKILVTTRLPKVANAVRVVKSFPLSVLSEEDGWAVFKKHAFPNRSNEADNLEELESIGKDIVRRCGGLPLSIKLLARLLYSKGNDESKWKEVLESNLLEHGVEENEQILGSLYLSYLYLSPKLKSCFKFCAIYPNGHFSPPDLQFFWLVHGLVNDMREAAECLEELQSTSFLSINAGHRNFLLAIHMHDHIYDLAQFVLGENHRELNYYAFSEEPNVGSRHASLTRLEQLFGDAFSGSRHVSLTFHELQYTYLGDHRRNFDVNVEVTKLHTLKLFNMEFRSVNVQMFLGQCLRELEIGIDIMRITSSDGCRNPLRCLRVLVVHKSCTSIPHWVSQLYNLRYLNVQQAHIERLPDSVCDLRNLRWLYLSSSKVKYLPVAISRLTNLRGINLEDCGIMYLPKAISRLTNLLELNLKGSQITYLPNTISELVNLQELNLACCQSLTELPEGIANLTNLRILNLHDTPIFFMPKGFGALTKLEILTDYAISFPHAGLAELKNMKHLRDVIVVDNLCEAASEEDAAQAEMSNKKHLQALFLRWSDFGYNGCMDPTKYPAFPSPFLSSTYFKYQPRRPSGVTKSRRCKRLERGNQESVAHHEEGIFRKLRPHHDRKELFISDYRGFELPSWMGDESFTKLKTLFLYEINFCTSLSPMDKLPSLVMLVLESMDKLQELVPNRSIRHVDSMLPATEQGQSFPKLKYLYILHCKSVELLPLCKFSSLEYVKAHRCLNLKHMEPPYHIPCPLENIYIHGCPKFHFSPEPHLPRPSWTLNVLPVDNLVYSTAFLGCDIPFPVTSDAVGTVICRNRDLSENRWR